MMRTIVYCTVGVAGGGWEVHGDRQQPGWPRHSFLPHPGAQGPTGLPGIPGLHKVSPSTTILY